MDQMNGKKDFGSHFMRCELWCSREGDLSEEE